MRRTATDALSSKPGRVADLGWGHGASVILMAQAFPKSKFVGIDSHESSIAVARERAKQAGVADRIRFEVATPRVLASSKEKFDLVPEFFHPHKRVGKSCPPSALSSMSLSPPSAINTF